MGGVVNRRVNIDPTKNLSRINFILCLDSLTSVYVVCSTTLGIHNMPGYAIMICHFLQIICRDMPNTEKCTLFIALNIKKS